MKGRGVCVSVHDATLLMELSEQTAREFPLRDKLRWEWAHRDDGSEGIIVPSKLQPFLYRGQNRQFSPCWPTICRGFRTVAPTAFALERSDQLLLIKRLAHGRWFERTLDNHPAIRWASQQHLYINRPALAQHYGIPTGYIDLTENFDVAAFFATCYFDRQQSTWCPCASGEGIFYRLHWRRVPAEPKRIHWIGLQPLPRPAEQWAWTCELFGGEEFEQAPFLQMLRFTHSAQVGEHFLRKFAGGGALFPSDPLTRVADRINQASRLPLWALVETIADIVGDPQGLPNDHEEQLLIEIESKLGVVPEKDCPSPMTEADIAELDAIWDRRKDDFLKGVGIRLVRTLRQEGDGSDRPE